jgi:hypothetical protein
MYSIGFENPRLKRHHMYSIGFENPRLKTGCSWSEFMFFCRTAKTTVQ